MLLQWCTDAATDSLQKLTTFLAHLGNTKTDKLLYISRRAMTLTVHLYHLWLVCQFLPSLLPWFEHCARGMLRPVTAPLLSAMLQRAKQSGTASLVWKNISEYVAPCIYARPHRQLHARSVTVVDALYRGLNDILLALT